jgi:bifunctional DNase/RNase
MGEVRVVGIRVEQPQNQPVLLLRESNGDRYLPIWIGQSEAAAIALEQQGVEPARPLTHDLIGNILKGLEVRVDRVVINDLRDDTFYAKINLTIDSRNLEIDSRPSDAIALAVRAGCPLYVEEQVLKTLQSRGS